MMFDQNLLDDIFQGEKSICFFIHHEKYYWVIDHKYNFSLDAEKDYRAYLSKGYITQEQYLKACKEFRFGILKLTSDNFLQYIENIRKSVFTCSDLEGIFEAGTSFSFHDLLMRVEFYYSFSRSLDSIDFNNAEIIASRLPLFYINFDKKIYMHMDSGRSHESLSYPEWLSMCSDFCYLIPDKERYWTKNGDYWKFRFLSS